MLSARSKQNPALESTAPMPESGDPADIVAGLNALLQQMREDGHKDVILSWPWQQMRRLTVLDIDFHGGICPSEEDRRRLLTRLEPRPAGTWLTPKGCKAWYVDYPWPVLDADDEESRDMGLTAHDLASLAAHQVCLLDSSLLTGVETAPTFTMYWGDEFPVLEDPGPQVLRFWKKAAMRSIGDEAAVAEWLEELGIDPDNERPDGLPCPHCGGEGGRAITITDGLLKCFRCGVAIPLAQLAGTRTVATMPDLYLAARHFVHYGHQKHILASLFPQLGKWEHMRAWRCLLTLAADLGPADPRVGAALNPNKELMRGYGQTWLESDFSVVRDKLTSAAGYPWVQEPRTEGEGEDEVTVYKANRDKLRSFATAKGGGPLKGYTQILPWRGFPLWFGPLRSPAERLVSGAIVCQRPTWATYKPRYMPASQRRPMAECRALLEEMLPGLCWDYLTLLLWMAAAAESRIGMLPIALVTGPSGSGKSMTVEVVCRMLGAPVTRAGTMDADDYARAVGSSAKDGDPMVIVDEAMKTPAKGRIFDRLNLLLGLGRDGSKFNLKYLPARAYPVNLAMVLTDTAVPTNVSADLQIGRRMVSVTLSSSVNWDGALISSLRETPERARVCDEIISYIADAASVMEAPRNWPRYLSMVSGFPLLRDSTQAKAERVELTNVVTQLLRILDDQPAGTGATSSQPANDGFRYIPLGATTLDPAAKLWAQLADGEGAGGWSKSRRLTEADLADVIGHPIPVRVDMRRQKHGDPGVQVRFTDDDGKVNGQILGESIVDQGAA